MSSIGEDSLPNCRLSSDYGPQYKNDTFKHRRTRENQNGTLVLKVSVRKSYVDNYEATVIAPVKRFSLHLSHRECPYYQECGCRLLTVEFRVTASSRKKEKEKKREERTSHNIFGDVSRSCLCVKDIANTRRDCSAFPLLPTLSALCGLSSSKCF